MFMLSIIIIPTILVQTNVKKVDQTFPAAYLNGARLRRRYRKKLMRKIKSKIEIHMASCRLPLPKGAPPFGWRQRAHPWPDEFPLDNFQPIWAQ